MSAASCQITGGCACFSKTAGTESGGSQLSFFLLNAILTNSVISLNRFSASHVALVVKNLPTSAGDVRDMGSAPGLGRSPGEGNGNPLQYPCLENPVDLGAYSPWGCKESDMTEWVHTQTDFGGMKGESWGDESKGTDL